MVKIRQRGAHVQYDIRFRWPDGTPFRERANAPVASKSGAQRWAEARERELLAAGKAAHDAPPVTNDTFAVFWPRVVRDHYRANRKKPSTIDAAETIFDVHLGPALGSKRLDEITTADVAALKGALGEAAPKTVNNVLSVLSRALRCAVDWGILPVMPCKIGFLHIPKGEAPWYEVHDYRRLVDAARKLGTSRLVLVLLAGSAGLRRGEIRALKWTDLDMGRKLITVQRGLWRLEENTPKGGRGRVVPMTPELYDALKAHRHLRERVLYTDEGRELSNRTVRNWLGSALRRAGLPVEAGEYREPKNAFQGKACKRCEGTLRRPVKRKDKWSSLCVTCERRRRTEGDGPIHRLRHTFCSHLAAAGVPAKAIQELAGHADLATTQRYMHLSPANRSQAMATLAAYYVADGEEKGAKAG